MVTPIKSLVKCDYEVAHPFSGTQALRQTLINHAAVVVRDEKQQVFGILTPIDIARHSYNLVIDCLTPKPDVPSSYSIDAALELMQERKTDVLAVVDGRQFQGLVFKNDLVRFLNRQKDDLHQKVTESFTRLEQTQHHLSSTKKVLKALFDNTQSVKVLVSPECQIMFFNKRAYEGCLKFYGVKLKVGENLLRLFSEKNRKEELLIQFESDFARALAGETVVTEKKLAFSEDTSLWLRSEVGPVYEENILLGVAATFYNIEELKRREQYIKEQHNLLRSISWVQSHKTRQPLASILGLLNIIDKSDLSVHNQQVVDLLHETAAKLDEIIKSTIVKANSLPEVFYRNH